MEGFSSGAKVEVLLWRRGREELVSTQTRYSGLVLSSNGFGSYGRQTVSLFKKDPEEENKDT